MSRNIPNLFIVGAPKCGTTSMYEYLKSHPDIFMSEEKEPGYFDFDHNRSDRFSESEYFSFFNTTKAYKFYGEASPMYLYSEEAPQHISKIVPNAKIIIMLRNPVDLIQSMHYQNLRNGVEHISDFKKAYFESDNRKKGLNIRRSNQPHKRMIYNELGLFSKYIQRYEQYFGQDNVHIILFDDLKDEGQEVLAKVFDFLHLPAVSIDTAIHNTSMKNRSNFLHRFVKYPPPAIRKIARILMPAKMRALVFQQFKRMNQVQLKKPPIPNELREKLVKQFYNDIIFLEGKLNRDLSSWK